MQGKGRNHHNWATSVLKQKPGKSSGLANRHHKVDLDNPQYAKLYGGSVRCRL